MRLRARVDYTQHSIVSALRAAGYSVAITSQLGKGFPDIVVGKNKKNCLLEIKDDSKPLKQRALTRDEEEWHGKWLGQVNTVGNVVEALRIAYLVCS